MILQSLRLRGGAPIRLRTLCSPRLRQGPRAPRVQRLQLHPPHATSTSTSRGLRGHRSSDLSPSLLGAYRVRSIIMLQEKAQDRERLLLKFIKIMKVAGASPEPARCPRPPPPPSRPPGLSPQHLRKLNNFNSYLAILSALDSAPIRRLEWQKQTSEVGGWEGSHKLRGPALRSLRCRGAGTARACRHPPPHLSFPSLFSSLGGRSGHWSSPADFFRGDAEGRWAGC